VIQISSGDEVATMID